MYGRKFAGHVDSIAGATGARLSLLPPENATGNFVKVVQRVPVTESSGRIHTSAVTVAVLPEADEVEIDLGGQGVRLVSEGGQLPDLVLVDGGITQVNAAREEMGRLGLSRIPVAGLAKRMEEILRHQPDRRKFPVGMNNRETPGRPRKDWFRRVHRRGKGLSL
jgi:hypothetical protein